MTQKTSYATLRLEDKNYPSLLKQICDPPSVLYIRGEFPSGICLGVVGTRRMSEYGERVTKKLVRELVQYGFVIVSGLALGIDTVAHETALAHGGKTVAVMGNGVNDDVIFPSQNRRLAQRIIQSGGAILSEFPPETKARPYHFPMRNRIISGMCRGILVVEAPRKSGALLTAQMALEQNRDVFAIPGNILGEKSEGPNALIQNGAKLITGVEDILQEFGIEIQNARKKLPQFSLEEQMILQCLKEKSLNLEELRKATNLDIKKLSSTLTLLELNRMVEKRYEKFSYC